MRNLPLLFCGILFTFMAAWTGLILTPNLQLGGLQPESADPTDPTLPRYPQQISGLAAQGRQVYIEMGCIYCHTQQVRPASLVLEVRAPVMGGDGKPTGEFKSEYASPDIARAWAQRGTVARDYILEPRLLLGTMRTGPDLADVGSRGISAATSDWHFRHLYDPRLVVESSIMPPFRFLFKLEKIGDKPSPLALTNLPPGYAHAPPPGYEIVPTDRALALVAYLRSLRVDYELPEAKFAQ